MTVQIRRLAAGEASRLAELNRLFALAFEDEETYQGARPSEDYLQSLLADPGVVAIVALDGETMVGGLVAYELRKFEQTRSELYIYDLAVLESHRRRGIATALIGEVQSIAAEVGAWVIFVQADRDDVAPITLYSKLGRREDVHHFDIPPRPRGS